MSWLAALCGIDDNALSADLNGFSPRPPSRECVYSGRGGSVSPGLGNY